MELMDEPVTAMKLSPCGLELEEVQTATQRYDDAVQSLQRDWPESARVLVIGFAEPKSWPGIARVDCGSIKDLE